MQEIFESISVERKAEIRLRVEATVENGKINNLPFGEFAQFISNIIHSYGDPEEQRFASLIASITLLPEAPKK